VRVVFDTNVLVSAIVFPGSVADRALGHVLPDGTDTLLLSDALLDELLTVMARKFARDAEALSRLAIFLVGNSERVEPRVKVSVLADDPDNRVLECAVSGKADAIITGDKKMLVLRRFESIPVLNLRSYLMWR
jgi:uncharacterized protein